MNVCYLGPAGLSTIKTASARQPASRFGQSSMIGSSSAFMSRTELSEVEDNIRPRWFQRKSVGSSPTRNRIAFSPRICANPAA
jgi:hypothetical protein